MKIKLIMLLILAIFLFSIGSVSAMDDNNDTLVSNDNMLSVNDETVYSNDTYSISEEKNDYVTSENKDSTLDSAHYGYWSIAYDVPTFNFTDLSNHGVTDILLNYYVFERYNQSFVESLALDAKEHGINIHIWTQVFYDGSWVRPVDREGNVNYEYFDKKTAEFEYYASTKGIAGIHYDYLRFFGSEFYYNAAWQNPGGKEAITYFVKQCSEAIRKVNPDLIISAALMPEIDMLEPVYGVEYREISKYLDVAIPMAYRGNFNEDSNWIKYVTEYFVNNSGGCEVWTGLQSYVDDNHENNLLPIVQLTNDTISSFDGGAKGVIMFKINLCENIDFNNLTLDENQLSSFDYLYYKISSAVNTLNLENDFIFNETTDDEFVNGINIYTNNLIINGNNHIIDGKNLARIFNITGNGVTLANIQFKNAFNNDSGAAAYVSADRVNFINCTFTDNFAENMGGAIYTIGNYGLIDNCTFINSKTNGAGGAAYVNGYMLKIANSTFLDNYAKVEAGAVFIKDDCGYIENCTFINNSAKYNGAVMLLSQNAHIYDSYFENNNAEISAGAVGMGTRSNMAIENCVFINNGAYNEGGAAIFVNRALNARIINSNFLDNFAHYYGGAVFWSYGNNGTIANSTFINNNATEKGGAIYHIGNNITLSDNFFMVNNCVNGSAIYLNNGTNNVLSRNVLLFNDLNINNIDDSKVLDSVILDKIISNNSTVIYTNNWFGNTKDNYNESLNENTGNWLYLNASSDKARVGSDALVKFYFNQFNTTQSFDMPEFFLNLMGYNAVLDKDTVEVGNSVNLHITDYGAYVKASFGDVTFTYELPIADVNVFADNVKKYYGDDQRFVVRVLDDKSNPISNKSVKITINGIEYPRTTDENGSASIPVNLNAGEYNVTAAVSNITVNSSVIIYPTVYADDLVKVFKNESQYYARFIDSKGNLLKNTKVSFNINGVYYNRTTDDTGSAKLNINLMAGEYVITAFNPNTGEKHSNNITVLSRFSEYSDLVKYYRNDSQYVVRVIGDGGNPVGAGEVVTFNINGVLYNRTTNESGYVKLNINLNPGDYIITAEYKGCMISNIITVKSVLFTGDMNMHYNDGSKFTATLLNGNGNPYPGQTVKFNVNGMIYSRTTDSNGEAKMDIRLMPGEYIITSSYNGYATSNKITVS